MIKTQPFSYHAHSNAFGIYDGRCSADKMINQAVAIGFEAIGISNHLTWHPNMRPDHRMFFSDYQQVAEIARRNVEQLRELAAQSSIKVYVGFEVDYFQSPAWQEGFEKLLAKLNVDYLIGATHFLKDDEEKDIINLYHFQKYSRDEAQLKEMLKNYWLNIVGSINSGYFNFIAHLDVCKLFNFCTEPEWDEYKWQVIEALSTNKTPYELNTSGWTKCGEQHPWLWMIEELNRRNVPIVISDDAHTTEHIGQHFEKAEELLASINYTNRFQF